MPLPVATVYAEAEGVEPAGRYEPARVRSGGKWFVDSDKLPTGTRDGLVGYMSDVAAFWGKLSVGEEPGPWVAVTRTLGEWKQRKHTDLAPQMRELDSVPVLGDMVAELLAPAPQWDVVNALTDPLNGWVERDSTGATRVEVCWPGQFGWSSYLGGPCSPGEQARRVIVGVRHAKWRDRKARRLVRVVTQAVELWPKP